jgi:hypothetical protein
MPFRTRKEIFTLLPNNVAVIRALAVVAFTSLIAWSLKATVFCRPVALVGTAFAGWTIYSHLLSRDPLMEAIYIITGGRDRFEALPEINLVQAPDEKISQTIRRINWEYLRHPVAPSRTLDGRNVIIIKGLSRNNDGLFGEAQMKGVLAFVEKTSTQDFESAFTNLQKLFCVVTHALIDFSDSSSAGYQSGNHLHQVYSSISCDVANELYAQLGIPGKSHSMQTLRFN